MENKKIRVSIVIVNYRVKKELFVCIDSIKRSNAKVSYEIIVVGNDGESKIEKELTNKFSEVKYIKSSGNLGYGGGNNLGARYAQGEYLFFLNPDTKILDGTLDHLYNFFIKNNKAGIVSPVFFDNNLKPFKSQGSKELTPKNIIFSQSILRKIFPNRNIFNNVPTNWDMKNPIIVDTVPGAAMMISSKLFKKIGGFDEKFFLYFEENDISKRVGELGYKLFIVASAKIIHLVGRSTKNFENAENIYSKSRYLYLKKYYGVPMAIFTQVILSINITSLFVLSTLILAFFLRMINIENNMPFIGDQGWFYLSARDMVLNGQIPLVGIASSHPWLHQGPLWTYMLASIFWLYGFNPINGAYLTIILGVLSVALIYIVGKKMFSKKVGLISMLLYATSPLAITHARTPYHTSPIPLFALLLMYSLYKWVRGNNIFFPLSIFFLAILYNLELATSTLWIILLIILIYGIWKKKEWVSELFNKKILIYSLVAFFIPMLPILIYDSNHGFPQTLKFIVWIGYQVLRFFGFPSVSGENGSVGLNSMLNFSFHFYQNLIFAASSMVAVIILILSFGTLLINIYNLIRKKTGGIGFVLLSLWILVSLAGNFFSRTSSEAYLPILFPALIFLTAFSLSKIMKVRGFFIPAILLIAFVVFSNINFVIRLKSLTEGFNFSRRITIAKAIVKIADRRKYNIIGIGDGSKFESFTMNYEYLTWWLGHSPSKSPQRLKFTVEENENGIFFNQK